LDILKKYNFDSKTFETLREKYIKGQFTEKDNKIKGKVEPPPSNLLNDLTKLDNSSKEKYSSIGREVLKNNKLGVVIVNGGMATRFGGGVKGIVDVFDGKSFLKIKLQQIRKTKEKFNCNIEIFIMNSFATEKATIEHLKEYKDINFFSQFIFKRLNPDGTEFNNPENPLENFYGPGHGDFIFAFKKSGLLDRAIKKGIEYIWYSNVDNLGATIDEVILGFSVEKNFEMTAEVAEKFRGDKGGAPAIVDGKIQIVEGFKFPDGFDINSISVFNTATYIFQTKALKKIVETPGFELPWYIVKKKVKDKEVIQFERLTGDLSIFMKTGYVVVDRNERFFPVKTPEDLIQQRDFLRKKFG